MPFAVQVTDEAEVGCHVCLVGTKLDLVQSGAASRAVQPSEVEALAAKHRAHLFETSSKAGDGVGDIFNCIVQQFQQRANAADGPANGRAGMPTGGAAQKSGCC